MLIRSGARFTLVTSLTLVLLSGLAGCSDTRSATIAPTTAAKEALPRVERGRLKFVPGFEQGLQQARREAKPVLLFFTAPWCGFCHQMAQEAFTDERVVTLSEQFVCVLIDADQQPEVCREFRVRGYPTIQFLSPRGVPLNRVTGKKPGHQLATEMQSALQAVARRTDWPPQPGYRR